MAAIDRPVTHLFTDLEGSTRLWESEPLRMRDALDRHDSLARQIVLRFGGQVVKMTGDGVHGVFDDSVDAINACVQFTMALGTLAKETGLPLRARCGLHAGNGHVRDGEYYGGAVNRAARIMNAAHGGQVLLSEVVALLVNGRLPADIGLRDLGRVRLRDLAQPEQVHQLLHPALLVQFPPLRSLDSTPNNLPQQPSSFVGRQGAIAELRELLFKHRLLTLSGPGGIGKTRLALQLAADVLEHFADGVWFVELASLSDPKLVPQTVARLLGVVERPGIPDAVSITEFLAARHALLILDNCEHVADACATLTDTLLRGAAHLRILATSREVLRVPGERLYALPPLSVPTGDELNLEAARHYPGVALFVDRAREQQSSFEVSPRNLPGIIAICRELDGIPLALELAAARVRSMSIENIALRLSDRFRLLGSGSRTALPRHQTLAAMVAWSHQLLNDGERALFERLSLFAGGFDLDDASGVCSFSILDEAMVLDILMSLVDKSLVMTVAEADRSNPAAVRDASDLFDSDPSIPGRYRMLETIRAFAHEQLALSGSATETARRHAMYFLDLAARADEEIRGPRKPYWCARLTAEHDNLRAAMNFLRGPGSDPDAALRFGVKLAAYWRFQGHATEGRAYLRSVLAHPEAANFPRAYAGAMLEGGILASFQGDNDEARELGEASLALYRSLGRPSEESSVLIMLGVVLQSSGALAEARVCHEQALAISRTRNAKAPQAICLVNLANVDMLRGDATAARTGLVDALEVLADSGEGTASVYAHEMLGQLDLREGALLAARDRFVTANGLALRTGDVMQQAKTTMLLGRTDVALGDEIAGRAQLAQGLEWLQRLAQKEETILALDMAAEVLQMRGDDPAATRVRAACRAARTRYKFHWPPLDRAIHERDEAASVDALGEEPVVAAHSQGVSWTLQQAVDFALERMMGTVAPTEAGGLKEILIRRHAPGASPPSPADAPTPAP
jgi:predicted ATPase/class 3 adenylate cyclase